MESRNSKHKIQKVQAIPRTNEGFTANVVERTPWDGTPHLMFSSFSAFSSTPLFTS